MSNWKPEGPGGGDNRSKCAAPAPAAEVVSVVRVIHPAGGAGAIAQTPSFGVKSMARWTMLGRVRQRVVDGGGTLGDEDGALALGGWGDYYVPGPLSANGC